MNNAIADRLLHCLTELDELGEKVAAAHLNDALLALGHANTLGDHAAPADQSASN